MKEAWRRLGDGVGVGALTMAGSGGPRCVCMSNMGFAWLGAVVTFWRGRQHLRHAAGRAEAWYAGTGSLWGSGVSVVGGWGCVVWR